MTTLIDSLPRPPDEGDVASTLLASVELLPSAEQRLITLLAVAVSSTGEDLAQAAVAVWDEEPVAETLISLRNHPLIESVGSRMRVVAPLGVALARQLHDADPDRFVAAHEAFAALEQAHADDEAANDELQAWETRSRIAYYLLSNTPTESASLFIDSFDASPASSRRTCRLWLSGLAARYTGITHKRTRVGDFFEGFRYYIAQDRERAGTLFEELIEVDRADKIAAVSLHLLALCLDRKREESRRLALLDESIALSDALQLPENLLMTRNSAIYSRLDIARRLDDATAAARALELARENDLLARSIGHPVYETATRRALAVAQWQSLVGAERGGALAAVLSILRDAQAKAEQAHDLSAWILAAISASHCFRTVGKPLEALAELEAAVLQIEIAVALPDLPSRQFFDELDRVLNTATDEPEFTDRCDAVGRRFRRTARRSA
jgi:hypothetical protein